MKNGPRENRSAVAKKGLCGVIDVTPHATAFAARVLIEL
jgi:hypothetical protein